MGYDTGISSLRKLQEALARKVILNDRFGKISIIGGADVAYRGSTAACAIVLFDYGTMEETGHVCAYDKVLFPYIPGLLSFREGPPIKKAYAKLSVKPDMLLINGNGILHPRFFGIASHIGVELGIPTIGVAQHLLCGDVKRDGKIYIGKRHVGYEYVSKPGCAPIYLSPGHKVSVRSSLEIVKKCMRAHKLPEPVHAADRLSKKCIKAHVHI
ncbi:MAG: endonuclease V [Candidatus Micrarchaeota archaeon]|nr:endonuclease V [Candidatus Micrarchaeota archaeon]